MSRSFPAKTCRPFGLSLCRPRPSRESVGRRTATGFLPGRDTSSAVGHAKANRATSRPTIMYPASRRSPMVRRFLRRPSGVGKNLCGRGSEYRGCEQNRLFWREPSRAGGVRRCQHGPIRLCSGASGIWHFDVDTRQIRGYASLADAPALLPRRRAFPASRSPISFYQHPPRPERQAAHVHG